jgi:hypothetical protein
MNVVYLLKFMGLLVYKRLLHRVTQNRHRVAQRKHRGDKGFSFFRGFSFTTYNRLRDNIQYTLFEHALFYNGGIHLPFDSVVSGMTLIGYIYERNTREIRGNPFFNISEP